MKLDDLQSPKTAAVMAQLLKKHHGIQMPVDRMSVRSASVMLENVQSKLTKFRNSHASHVAERNSDYLAMLMVEQTLKALIAEETPTVGSAMKTMGKDLWRSVKNTAGDVADSVKSDIPGARVSPLVSKSSSNPGPIDMYKSLRGSDTYTGMGRVPAAKQSTIDTASGKLGVDPKTLKALANKPVLSAKDAQTLAQAMQTLLKNPGATQALHKLTENTLMESSVGEAEVVLAAKDMADRVQDMVETLGKMVNEELPALNETIRDTISPEQADAFTLSATEAINTALETVRQTKNSLDAATRTLAGEETAEPTDTQGLGQPDDLEATEPSDLSAPLAEPEPLGRGKR